MKRLLISLLTAAALTACGGGGTSDPTMTPQDYQASILQRFDAIDGQQNAGSLSKADAAKARLAIIQEVQKTHPELVAVHTSPISALPPGQTLPVMPPSETAADTKKHPELGTWAWITILTRGFMLSGDTCVSCELADRPIDFGSGGGSTGWDPGESDNANAH